MTRRKLWALTTICCALLALPTLVRLVALVAPVDRWWGAAGAAIRQMEPRTVVIMRSIPTAGWQVAEAIGRAARRVSEQDVRSSLEAHWRGDALGAGAIAAVAVGLSAMTVMLVDRRRRQRRLALPQRVRRLAARGTEALAIARRTGLPQDAVRQLVQPRPEGDGAAFADLLATSLHPTPAPLAGFRSDR